MRGSFLVAVVTAAVATLAGPGPAGAVALGVRVAPGTQLWAARFQAGGDPYSAVAVSPGGGRVFVTGASFGGRATGVDYETVAYSAAGRRLWAARYSGPRRFEDDPAAVAVSPDGATVFVTGEAAGWGTGHDYATVAYRAADGRRLWASRYNGQAKGYDVAAAVAVSPGGGMVFVTGTSMVGVSADYATVAYSAADGRRLWVSRYHVAGNGFDAAQSVAVSPGGAAVFVTGYGTARLGGYADYATVAYRAADGTQMWASRYHGPANGFGGAGAVVVNPAGTAVFVTGDSKGRATGYDYATVAYGAADGRQLWVSRYHGYRNKFDAAIAIAVSPGGGTVYVTGTSQGRAGTNYATLAYSAATGRQLWASRYHGYRANSVAVSPDGAAVYVTGSGSVGGGYATVAYRAADGRQLWARRYHVPGDSGAGAFTAAVSPAGTTVYVTGNVGNRTIDAYATIAYHS